MESMTKLKARVRNGSQLLRELEPDWYKKVNPDTIDFHNPKNCILGQVFGNYCEIANKLIDESRLDIFGFDNGFAQCGFDLAFHHDKDDEIHLIELWTATILRIKNDQR